MPKPLEFNGRVSERRARKLSIWTANVSTQTDIARTDVDSFNAPRDAHSRRSDACIGNREFMRCT